MNSNPFQTIAIGVAFSPNLKANLYEAARLSGFFNSKLVLIHVGEPSEEKKSKINEILEPFIKEGISTELLFRAGDPVEIILACVIEKKVDLLILGALQRENFLKYYVGSIARKITRKALCSVLLHINPSIERIPCKHIVVNGLKDERTQDAIAAAFYMGHALQSEQLTIVEEISQEEIAVKVDDDKSLRRATLMKEKLRRREDYRIKEILETIPEEHKKNMYIKTQPIFGKRGYSIGHYAKVVRADLLVMNAPGKIGFWDRFFPHDIEHILTELPTDVLIIQ
ncbi:universal stress protein [Ulvibacter antarcticus]|uniref:Nucleotide-binding universal stress UspA family protein n=1 Tax=Ulvibacter antarcticus TaxID=442714 RepID=A0A3L9YZH1_9FLAO|nr:universal stress protein [Ulvibacter antarcticus]RMA66036.1 nucleotide-binding universal stress UspA family protein [Ulvibacter antarcticus]